MDDWWKGASKQAIRAYANLCDKLCRIDLQKFRNGDLNGQQLYERLVSNLESAASTCIPKQKDTGSKSHNVPLWRQRMSTHQTAVDYWLQTQFLQGGANRCHLYVREQLRFDSRDSNGNIAYCDAKFEKTLPITLRLKIVITRCLNLANSQRHLTSTVNRAMTR